MQDIIAINCKGSDRVAEIVSNRWGNPSMPDDLVSRQSCAGRIDSATAVHYPRRRVGGFTVLELLFALALLVVLAVILALQAQRMGRQTVEIKCVYRLRQVGMLFHSYANEQPNRTVRLFQEGTTTQASRWYDLLQQYASLTKEYTRESFGCPAFPADEVTGWTCYGFRVGGPPGEIINDGGKVYRLMISAVESPSTVLLAADTYSLRDFTQIFRIVPPKLYNRHAGVHLRHRDRANVLFMDGHVRALSRNELHGVGIDEALDRNGVLVYTTPPP